VLGERPAPLPPTQHWLTVGRTVAAIAGVTVLSSYLNRQLASSASLLVDLRALNENIVRSLGSGLLSCDPDGRLVYFNPAAREILSLSDADLGRPIDEVLPGFHAVPDPAQADVPRGELAITTRTGKRLHVGLSRTPLLDGRGRSIGDLVIFQDLTRLHELTEKVRRSERLAALGGMAASVAHEIRNPLAAISGSAELLSSLELEHDDRRLLSIIRRESTRLSDLVTDLLAFTRPRAPQVSTVNVSRLVRETCEAFSADPANAGIDVEVAGEEAVTAELDGVQLSQVLWNLLRNASEAMQGKGHVRVRVSRPGERAQISVTDDGPGIEAGLREKVFDPFFTTKDHGTGFGLAIAHRIVGDNGGTLELDDRVERGARFVLRFPLAASSSGADRAPDADRDADRNADR
jgi:two-component system sensor histidine kinase PilS (NtrC family)